jgi:hypothetical protein
VLIEQPRANSYAFPGWEQDEGNGVCPYVSVYEVHDERMQVVHVTVDVAAAKETESTITESILNMTRWKNNGFTERETSHNEKEWNSIRVLQYYLYYLTNTCCTIAQRWWIRLLPRHNDQRQ